MRTGSTSAASALSSASGSNNNPFHTSSSNNSSFNNGFNNGAFPDGRNNGGDEDDAGDYLFAPVQETVFAYPGTPAASSFNSEWWFSCFSSFLGGAGAGTGGCAGDGVRKGGGGGEHGVVLCGMLRGRTACCGRGPSGSARDWPSRKSAVLRAGTVPLRRESCW
ncbi:hypothetical protein B0H11DRAFT_2237690 [Mycena galericulata]|nr:hypothetical protein B0H11DRAFT_2237690 [Mycena galericulata]